MAAMPLDEAVRKSTFGLRPIRKLQVLCQIEVLQLLHQKAEALEQDYFIRFLDEGLQYQHKSYERMVDIRQEKLDEVVNSFEDLLKSKLENEKKKELKGRIKKAAGLPRREGLRSSNRTQPYMNCERVVRVLQKTQKDKIVPKGITTNAFILYKKCKLMYQISLMRNTLASIMNRSVMNQLLEVWQNIMEYFNKNETSFAILQSMLITSDTTQVNLAPLKLWKLISSSRPHVSVLSNHYHRLPESMETRTESTLIHLALACGSKLTQIKMAGCACDSFIKVIVQHCTSLKYLDISDSYVSDWGLYDLAGLTVVENRSARLPRRCKQNKEDAYHHRHRHPSQEEMAKTEAGLPTLTHLIANNLMSISWPPRSSPKKVGHPFSLLSHHNGYTDYLSVTAGCPRDSGFVMLLKHLPSLKVFMTEISARAIDVYSRDHMGRKNSKKVNLLPNMEMISEKHMDKDLMKAVLSTCPNIKSILVKTAHDGRDEEWMEPLKKIENQLKDICVMDSHFRGPNLKHYILEPKTGGNLSNLDMRGLSYLKMSWFQAIKINCQNLNSLTVGKIYFYSFASSNDSSRGIFKYKKSIYSVFQENLDSHKNMLLLYHYEV